MTDHIYLPINQGEQAKQKNRNTLLARDVFQKIASLLASSLAKINAAKCGELDDLDEHRAHEAILIDGGRGTGKSSVLVNLQLYMDGEETLKNDLLILKPVDPTLLENGDDLFLNIIVAALIRDKQIKNALNKGDKKAEQFYEQLQKLGNALEGVQTQREKHGLDKLRAFIGNHGIADEVHQLFKCAIDLTSKKLIVLPIDDVDTSLQHAFENMEVVRKYLASPFVVPIISGDLDLYHDVTWRDFYGRIIKDHKVELNEAKLRSKSLANEYQRKVLPLPRRINVPNIEDYFINEKIGLTADGSESAFIKLPQFKYWLNAMLNERVNGVEKSKFDLPIFSIRELTQLISKTKDLLVNLDINQLNEQEIIRKIIRNDDIFLKDHTGKQKSNLMSWYVELRDYFHNHEDGAAAYLVMSSNVEWLGLNKESKISDILAGDLFRPQNHGLPKYEKFNLTDGIRDAWGAHAGVELPSKQWRNNLPEKCALPYPLLEKGVSSGHFKKKDYSIINDKKIEFSRQLMFHSGFYNRSQEVDLILTGRVFELLIASITKDITEKDIKDLLLRAPFYSATELASTKTFNLSDDENNGNKGVDTQYTDLDSVIYDLTKNISQWREDNFLSSSQGKPHSWLVYNVMNKYFNQVSVDKSWILDREGYAYDNSILKYTIDVAIRSFESICAIFGSFEKSDLFGFGNKIAFRNGSMAEKDFEKNPLYLQNILPFLRPIYVTSEILKPDDKAILKSFTRAMYRHPLKELLDNAFSALPILTSDNLDIQKNKKNIINKKTTTRKNESYYILDSAIREYFSQQFTDVINPIDGINLLARNPLDNISIYQRFINFITKEELEAWEELKLLDSVEKRSIVGKFFNLMPKDDA